MALAPIDLAHRNITRSGRVDDTRMKLMSPRFTAQYEISRLAPTAE